MFFCFDWSFLVNQIGPGKGFDIVDFKENKKVSVIQEQVKINSNESPLQFIVDMVPDNIFYALGDNKLCFKLYFLLYFWFSINSH